MPNDNLTRADLIRTVARRSLPSPRPVAAPLPASAGGYAREGFTRKQNSYTFFALGLLVAAVIIAAMLTFVPVSGMISAAEPGHGQVHKENAAPHEPPIHSSSALDSKNPLQDFSESISRLADALAAQRPTSPEDVLKAVAVNGKDCTFQWENGQPALVYGGGSTVSASLNRCADAVERYHPPVK